MRKLSFAAMIAGRKRGSQKIAARKIKATVGNRRGLG